MHSSPLSPISSGSRSRSPEAGNDAAESHQPQRSEPSHDTIVDEPRESATHGSTGMAEVHTPPARGKRRPSTEGSSTPKRLRLRRADREEQLHHIAGPSRVILPEDTPSGALATRQPEVPAVHRHYYASSASEHYSPAGKLLYPDIGPSRRSAADRPHAGSSSSTSAPLRGDPTIDLDSIPDDSLRQPTQLTGHGSSSTIGSMSLARLLNFEDEPSTSAASPAQPSSRTPEPSAPETHSAPKLAEYICPICFSPPTYATLTPCGHVCCGECLFTAVKTSMQRSVYLGPAASSAKCPVCRAPIPGWDGKGAGVVGLKVKVVHDISGSPAKSFSK